jgi:hypothetical protein
MRHTKFVGLFNDLRLNTTFHISSCSGWYAIAILPVPNVVLVFSGCHIIILLHTDTPSQQKMRILESFTAKNLRTRHQLILVLFLKRHHVCINVGGKLRNRPA